MSALRGAARYRGRFRGLHLAVPDHDERLPRPHPAPPHARPPSPSPATTCPPRATASTTSSPASPSRTPSRRCRTASAWRWCSSTCTGSPITEAARILGVREGTVKSRCARARGRLAGLLGHLRPRHPTSGSGRPGGRRERRGRRRRPTHEERDQGRPDRRRTVTDDQHAADDRNGEPPDLPALPDPEDPAVATALARTRADLAAYGERTPPMPAGLLADIDAALAAERGAARADARAVTADAPVRVGGRADAPSWSSSRPPPWSRRWSSGCSPRSRRPVPRPRAPCRPPRPPEVPVLAGGRRAVGAACRAGPLRLRTARRPGTTRGLPGRARGARRGPTGRRTPGRRGRPGGRAVRAAHRGGRPVPGARRGAGVRGRGTAHPVRHARRPVSGTARGILRRPRALTHT